MDVLTKQPGEKRIIAFDFGERLTGTKAIDPLGAITVAAVNQGLVSGSAALTLSGTSIVGDALQVFADGGTHGEDYVMTARIVDTEYERHEIDVTLRVLEG